MLALYSAIKCNWQLSISEKSIVGEKNSTIYFKDSTDLDFFYTDICFSFSLTNACSPYHVRKTYTVLSVANRVVGLDTHLNIMLLSSFENLNSISYIFQATHNILVLTDPIIMCIYLRTTDIHFRDQGNGRYLTSKLLKCDLVQILNNFRNLFGGILLQIKHLLFFIIGWGLKMVFFWQRHLILYW